MPRARQRAASPSRPGPGCLRSAAVPLHTPAPRWPRRQPPPARVGSGEAGPRGCARHRLFMLAAARATEAGRGWRQSRSPSEKPTTPCKLFPGAGRGRSRPGSPSRAGPAASLPAAPGPVPSGTHPWRSGVRRPERGRAAPRRSRPASRPGSLGLQPPCPPLGQPRGAGGRPGCSGPPPGEHRPGSCGEGLRQGA